MPFKSTRRRLIATSLVAPIVATIAGLQAGACAPAGEPRPIAAEIDATDILRGIQHSHLTIPVRSGALTLAYPKWIPGEHAPNGPVTQVVALVVKAGSSVIPWRRDERDGFLFHVDVPKGIDTLDVTFDYLSPPTAFGDGYGRTPNVTPHLLVLLFNHVVMYSADAEISSTPIVATVRIPSGWKFDCALRPAHADAGAITLPQVSLETLVDSPLLAGEHYRTIPLSEGEGAARISVAADSEADLAVDEADVDHLKHLVAEAKQLFGVHHYREYAWLISLGAKLDRNGLEHHESTDIREPESLFTDPTYRMRFNSVIPHEYVHSWNGKYRRPIGLVTRNYQEPMVDDLLWVYEGLTRYLGDVILRARSGLRTEQEIREYVSWVAAWMDLDRPGRAWRSIGDTARALPAYTDAPSAWMPERRYRDYYEEMLLVWLEADTIIRQKTNGARTLDDFCRAFFGGEKSAPAVRAYTLPDVISGLNAVAAYDWDNFFRARVETVAPHAPLEGLQNAGWKLAYDDTPNVYQVAREITSGPTDLSFSIGLWVASDGVITDVVHGSPAFEASIAPGMRVKSVSGMPWSADDARSAIVGAKDGGPAIELVVEYADVVRTIRLDYHGGLRYPHLVRDSAKPDLLTTILTPREAVIH